MHLPNDARPLQRLHRGQGSLRLLLDKASEWKTSRVSVAGVRTAPLWHVKLVKQELVVCDALLLHSEHCAV